METLPTYRRWRLLKAGGPRVEHLHERKRLLGIKPPPAPPVPPPTFHNANAPQPPAEPTGPVHMAAKKGQIKILEILLDRGGDINGRGSTGRSALHYAIEGSRTDAVRLFVERGANVEMPDSRKRTPLFMAVERGLEDAVVLLVERGADPNKRGALRLVKCTAGLCLHLSAPIFYAKCLICRSPGCR
jgi:hypothetical protein